MSDEEEYSLVDTEATEEPGDEWEELDVSDTEADRIARKQDREFAHFRERIKDADQFKVEGGVFDEATLGALYKLVQDGHIDAFGGPISTGKEAHVFLAEAGGDDARTGVRGIPRAGARPARRTRRCALRWRDMSDGSTR